MPWHSGPQMVFNLELKTLLKKEERKTGQLCQYDDLFIGVRTTRKHYEITYAVEPVHTWIAIDIHCRG